MASDFKKVLLLGETQDLENIEMNWRLINFNKNIVHGQKIDFKVCQRSSQQNLKKGFFRILQLQRLNLC
jgi:hypothetical protein